MARNMITDRTDYRRHLAADLVAGNLDRWRLVDRFHHPEVFVVRLLRRLEYLRHQPGSVARTQRFWARYRLQTVSIRLGLTLPPDVFGPGLSIAHYGSVVVNARARVGAFCRLHTAITIGLGPTGVPTIGDFVYIGPGAVIYGGVTVGDRAVIGANAVVGRDVPAGVTVAGSPARVVSQRDSSSVMPTFIPVPGSVARA